MLRTTALLIAVAVLDFPAQATQPASAEEAARQIEQRCERLIAHYDRYGAGRSTDSDGKRNHTRIGASIDCDEHEPYRGIAAMEKLMQDMKLKVPPPSEARSS